MCFAVSSDYSSHQRVPNGYPVSNGAPNGGANDIRQAQVFHGGYGQYPTHTNGVASMTPSMHDGMNPIGAGGPHHAASTSSTIATSSLPGSTKAEDDERTAALYGDLPESKRRKFILVDDSVKNMRVRVRVTLDQVEMDEMPDFFRKKNSVYPRSYFPTQMQSPPSSVRGGRFFDDDDPEGGELVGDDKATCGRTMVPVPMLEGEDAGEVAIPKIARGKKRREVTLNNLGYRMSWSQNRVFDGRIMFLQKSRTSLTAHVYTSSSSSLSRSELTPRTSILTIPL